ncbi:hypothetical protein LIT38_20330 [Bacillus sp. CMF12]|uniref:hypothetical protein n=1 Tax=Bacillus sp. CMF12 TaxID=2884834 RepID=UPI00207A1CD8|nr:hypothetical protein [Bacillus sp. CMF12]USK48859.1 hypothetical protein LIT38_20330 [Bacillus sp. CMF12]
MATNKVKVRVIEHSGAEHVTEVENYNAAELYQTMKAAQGHDTSEYIVVIGDVIIDSRSIKSVAKVESE